MALTVRPLVESDWRQVHEIVVEVATAGRTYAMPVPADEAETRRVWSAQHVVVAVEGDRVLGTAKAGPNREAQGSHVGTASFMVGSAARGRGVGRLLGEHVVAWHRDAGFRAIQFNAVVSTNVAAVTLWRRLGFVVVGTVPEAFALPDGTHADLHVMHLDLTRPPLYPAGDHEAARSRLLTAAARRFGERGWHDTTLADVAAEADLELHVATRMVASKGELLWAALAHVVLPPHRDVDTAVDALGLEEVGSVDERLDRFVDLVCRIHERLVPLVSPLNEAASTDPDARAIMRGSDLKRLGTARRLARLLCRGEQPAPDAADVVHVLMTTETHLGFVRVGWSMPRYAAWLRGALDHAVNGSAAAPR